MTVFAILMLIALVCFVLSAIGIASRINLESAGLAVLTIALLLNSGLIG